MNPYSKLDNYSYPDNPYAVIDASMYDGDSDELKNITEPITHSISIGDGEDARRRLEEDNLVCVSGADPAAFSASLCETIVIDDDHG